MFFCFENRSKSLALVRLFSNNQLHAFAPIYGNLASQHQIPFYNINAFKESISIVDLYSKNSKVKN
jgi:lysozyme family protein